MSRFKTIYDPAFSVELDTYTDNLILRICSKLNLDYEHVVTQIMCFSEPIKKTSNKETIGRELEAITLNGTNYLFDAEKRKIYTFEDKPKLVGRLDDDMNIIRQKKRVS